MNACQEQKFKEFNALLWGRLAEIVESNYFIKKSNNDVWGKYIIRYIKSGDDYIQEEYELENWYITLPVTPDTNIDELVKEFKLKTWEFTDKFMKENNLNFDDMHNYTCHQLCDWSWLTDEDGNIIRNGLSTKSGEILCDSSVTLVKYAKILKDIEEDKEVEE